MNHYQQNRIFDNSTPVVTNIIIINVLMLLACLTFNLDTLALFYPESPFFRPYQIVTHMFMHAGIGHLFFNMFALWMFGKELEKVWGSKRFFIFYFVCGIGAAVIYTLANYWQISSLETKIDPETLSSMKLYLKQGRVLETSNQYIAEWYSFMRTPCVGASGAVYGILLGFGMLFPNTVLRLLFPPIALKAKYFVMIYGALELYLAISQPGSNIAHTAHLGGMIFGFILIWIWRKRNRQFF